MSVRIKYVIIINVRVRSEKIYLDSTKKILVVTAIHRM